MQIFRSDAQDGIFLSQMFGRFHSPQTNCSSRSEQATEQRIGALQEKTESLRHGEAFFFAFFFFALAGTGMDL